MIDTTLDKARDEIVFALKRQTRETPARTPSVEPKEAPRLPVQVEKRDLEAAIDDMIERFPQTLDYLAK